jgi:hypothetical protein
MRAKRVDDKQKQLTKAEIRTSAIKMLTWSYCTVWVQNNLAVRGRKFIGKRGQADLMGFRNKDGVIVACEIKTLNDRLSDDQILFLNDIKKAGGLAYLAIQAGSQVELKEWEIKTI